MKKEELKEKLKRGLQFTADRIKETAKLSQLRAKVFSLKRKMNSDFTELGERFYELYKDGKVTLPEDEYLKSIVESLENTEREIDEVEEEIVKLKAKEVIEKELEEKKEEGEGDREGSG